MSHQIDKDTIKTLPPFPALPLEQIHLVLTPQQLDSALAELSRQRELGFDTESRPTFHKGQTSGGPHLIQLACDDAAYLFPVHAGQIPPGLKALLESPAHLLVGFGLASDRARLRERLGVDCTRLFDVGQLFDTESARISVGAVQAVARVFGQQFRKSKRQSTSNWASPVLNDGQRLYAGNDAWVALRVYRALQGKRAAKL